MIQLADDGELSDRGHAWTEPGTTRLFHEALKAMRSHWHAIEDDGRENLAFGILETEAQCHTACLAVGGDESVLTLRLTVRLGGIRRNYVPALMTLLKLQGSAQVVRLIPDPEDGEVRLEATAFLSHACDPGPVVKAIVNDSRTILEDDRLLAVVGPEPVRQAS